MAWLCSLFFAKAAMNRAQIYFFRRDRWIAASVSGPPALNNLLRIAIMNGAFKILAIFGVLLTPIEGHPQMQAGMAENGGSLVLRGRANVSELRPSPVSKEEVDVVIELKLEWVNEGKEPAIVVVDSLPTFRHWILTRDSGPLTENNLVHEEFGGENLIEEAEWRRLRSQLDRSMPPDDKVRILAPGEKWAFELTGSMTFPIKFDARAF